MKQPFGMSLIISETKGNKKVKLKGQYYLQKTPDVVKQYLFYRMMWICVDKGINTLAPSLRILFYHQNETFTLGYGLSVWSWEKLEAVN